jgi:hypothetical protein
MHDGGPAFLIPAAPAGGGHHHGDHSDGSLDEGGGHDEGDGDDDDGDEGDGGAHADGFFDDEEEEAMLGVQLMQQQMGGAPQEVGCRGVCSCLRRRWR